MIKGLSYNQSQDIYSRSWDSNKIPKYLNKTDNSNLNYNERYNPEKDSVSISDNNSYHDTEKNYFQNTNEKEKSLKNFEFKNLLKKKNIPVNVASSAPSASPIDFLYEDKNDEAHKQKSKSLKINSTKNKNISNNFGNKNLNTNKNLSCSVDDIYKFEPKSELKTKTHLLKSLVENVEDESENTYYENSERSFIENISICKSTTNGMITKSLDSPTVSEINVTPAVVSIINAKSKNNDLKQDLELYKSLSKKNINKRSNGNSSNNLNKSNSKSKFFGKKFFSRFKPFGWFDSQKRNNEKIKKSSSLSQSSVINYDEYSEVINESSSSSNNNKEQTDNEKSEITLISSHYKNFEFTSISNDSFISKDSNNSKTFVNSNSDDTVSEGQQDTKQILDSNILLDNSKESILVNENKNRNVNENNNEITNEVKNGIKNENENDIGYGNINCSKNNITNIINSKSLIQNEVIKKNSVNNVNDQLPSNGEENRKEKIFENGSDDSSFFSGSTLFADNLTFTEISPNIENDDNYNNKNDIEDIYKIEKFDESHILSTSSPKFENEEPNENIQKVDNIEIVEEKVNDIMNKMEKDMELNDNKIIESEEDQSNISSSSEIALFEYETESEVDISNLKKIPNYDSDLEVEIIAISSPNSENGNVNENKNNDLKEEIDTNNDNENDSYVNTLDESSYESKK